MKAPPRNVAASVLARLRKHADQNSLSFNDVLQSHFNDSFLARLAKSKHSDTVAMKGAQMLRVLGVSRARPTMDIDFLRFGGAAEADLVALVKDCAALEIPSDAVVFLPDSIGAEPIHEDADYVGTRIRIEGRIDNVRQKIQLDFGVGDAVYPRPAKQKFPLLLDAGKVDLRIYPAEASIAEKLHTMVKLDMRNSRMKDFYDIWIMSRELTFSAKVLRRAVDATFERRATEVPGITPTALTEPFGENGTHGRQWSAFAKRINEPELVGQFPDVVRDLARFFSFIFDSGLQGKSELTWAPMGPWRAPRKVR